MSRIIIGFLGWKVVHNIEFNIAMLFVCPCVSVCCIYIFETCDRLLQICCEYYDDFGGTTTPEAEIHTRRNNKVEETRTFEMWVIRLAENMLCATRSWRNVKFYYVYKFIDLQYQYGDSRNICLSFRF